MSNGDNWENMDHQQTEKDATAVKEESIQNLISNTETKELADKANDTTNDSKGQGIVFATENDSFRSILAYDSDSSSSEDMIHLEYGWRSKNDSDETSSSSDSSEDQDSDESSEEDSDESSEDDEDYESDESPHNSTLSENKGAIKKKNPAKSKGELTLDELPPVPDISSLEIDPNPENFIHMGNVMGITDRIVTVASIPNTPAYDLDTVLFLDKGKTPMGFVFDVLGQVTSPIYAVRFNSVDDIKNLQIQLGMMVYAAPKSKHTQYVFVQQLLKAKGSDASWYDDNEIPAEFEEFSDDETERLRTGPKKSTLSRKRPHCSESYKKFENTMNRRNILNTKFNKYMDSCQQTRLSQTRTIHQADTAFQNSTISIPPVFNPSIPPPNLNPYYMPYYQNPGNPSYVPPEYQWFSGNTTYQYP